MSLALHSISVRQRRGRQDTIDGEQSDEGEDEDEPDDADETGAALGEISETADDGGEEQVEEPAPPPSEEKKIGRKRVQRQERMLVGLRSPFSHGREKIQVTLFFYRSLTNRGVRRLSTPSSSRAGTSSSSSYLFVWKIAADIWPHTSTSWQNS